MAIKIKSNRRTARLLLGVHLDETDFSDVFGYARLECCQVVLDVSLHLLATPCHLVESHTS